MKTLGIFFLIAAALLVVGIFLNLSPSGSEERIFKMEEAVHESSKKLKDFADFGQALGYQAGQIDIRSDKDIFSTSSTLKYQREKRVFYFAIAAGIFGIVGLILLVTQTRRENYYETSDKYPGASLSQTNTILTQTATNIIPQVRVSNKQEKIGNIFLYVDNLVAGPYTLSEVNYFLSNESVTYQTLFCIEGHENWKPLSNLFT
jgi:hypothetical protein